MTQEEKQLLLQDLCARLHNHPIVHVEHNVWGFIETADLQVYGYVGTLKLLREDNETFCYLPIEECRPYLRPMDSMTEEEYREFLDTQDWEYGDSSHPKYEYTYKTFDWLNKKMFDYRGLIPMGLALPAKEEMYKI